MPKVSVIIPTYNRADFLKKAVQSVLHQTYQDYEILVRDDGSTDNTQQVISNFKDSRIRYTRNMTNIGVIQNRNNAVNNSKGKYIAFLDDDDEWLPEKLEKQMSIIEASPAKLGGVYSGAYSIDTKLGKIVKLSVPEYRGYILKHLLKNNFIMTSTLVLKKKCFEKVGLFDPEFKSASDFDMWIRVAEKFEFDYVLSALVNYNVHENRISSNYIRRICGLKRLTAKHRKLFAENKKALTNQLLNLGVAYCYGGKTKEGRKTFTKALKLDPFDVRLYYNLVISSFGSDAFREIKKAKKRFDPS